jgi:hypothetical protein
MANFVHRASQSLLRPNRTVARGAGAAALLLGAVLSVDCDGGVNSGDTTTTSTTSTSTDPANSSGTTAGTTLVPKTFPCTLDGIDGRCGQGCQVDDDCGATLHCGPLGACSAECVLGGDQCPVGLVCGNRGRCTAPPADPQGFTCSAVQVNLAATIPVVQLLLDQSGSMNGAFGNNLTRYAAMREALVGTDGVVTSLQSQVSFGATLYTGGNTCPRLRSSTPANAPNNAGPIATLITNNGPSGDTPTGESINATVASFPAATPGQPRVIVLATDGEPDTCAIPNPSNSTQSSAARQVAVNAAAAAYAAGIKLFILSVGSDISAAHQQAMANAGAGVPSNSATPAPYYPATNPAALKSAFETIIRGVRTCDFTLDLDVTPTMAPGGDVRLNGGRLTKDDANGWELVDARHIRLRGTSCDTFKAANSVALLASFPCPGGDR